MDVFEAIQKRRSIRAYEKAAIPKEKIEKILEAARLAPSAMNIQPWYFIVVTDAEKKEKISKSGRFAGFLKETPVVIVGCGDSRASPKWHVVDVSIAMQNMVLAATGEGLGTCWIGSFDEKLVKDILNIPEHYKVVALLAVGYLRKKFDLMAKIAHFIRRKKRLNQIVGFEEYKGRLEK